MSTGHGHPHSHFPNIQGAQAMGNSHPDQRPTLPRLGHDLTDPVDDYPVVRLVLEPRHFVAARGVIPDRSQEQHSRPRRRIGNPGEQITGDNGVGGDHHLGSPVHYIAPGHRIHLVPDTTQNPTPPPEDPIADDETADEGTADDLESWAISLDPTEPADAGRPESTLYGEQQAPEHRYVVARSWTDTPQESPATPVTQDPPSGRGRFWRMAGVVMLAALVGAATAAGVLLLLDDGGQDDGSNVTVVERVATEILSPADSGTTAAAVARRVLPSIVTVQVRSSDVGAFVADGSGSGVVLSSDGLLITNHHVVDDAQQVHVIFADGRTYDAEIVGVDERTDLAVLRIAADGLTAVEIGSTRAMAVGDTAIAIGSPLGLQGGPSVTVGVISAFERKVQVGIDDRLFGMLQTDAPITRGSSGGALVDDQGRLIGITTAIGVSDVGAEGLGFAIPIDLVTRITDDIIEFGEARHAFLGVSGSTFFTEAQDGATIPAGVAIATVFDDTAAAMAGIEAGDVMLSVNGVPVTTMEQLVTTIRLYRVDQVIDVVLTRDDTELTISVTLMERPEGV